MNILIDYYKVLGISRNASQVTIKKAFRREILKWHPDRNHSPEAEARTKQIIEAWEILKDPVKRNIYDRYFEKPVDYSAEFRQWQQQAQDIAKETAQKPLNEIIKNKFKEIIMVSLALFYVAIPVVIGIWIIETIIGLLKIDFSLMEFLEYFFIRLFSFFGLYDPIFGNGFFGDPIIFISLLTTLIVYYVLENKPVSLKDWSKTVLKFISAWIYFVIMAIVTKLTLEKIGYPKQDSIEFPNWGILFIVFLIYSMIPIVLFWKVRKILNDLKIF
ncbi:MAG: DnaJ domain-containing protein [Proteobacteria bacterium]|nr:DnaJ domain-containing protein [Pseudomonadota bacterium]